MLQLAHGFFAVQVIALEPVNGAHELGRFLGNFRKQEVGLFGVMQLLGKLVNVEQHRAQHLKKLRCILRRAALHQHAH